MPLIPIGLLYNFFDIGNSGLGLMNIPLEGIGQTLVLNEIFVSALIGALIGAAFFEITSRLGLLLVGEYAFGGGDTIIAAGLGAWFGWKMVIAIIVFSFIFQVIVGIPILLFKMYKDKDYKSIIFMMVLLLSTVIPKIGKVFGLMDSLIGALFVMLLALACAVAGMFVILKSARERQSFTFIPFGPALVAGGFLVMFFGPSILSWYSSLGIYS